jgi:molecular chaperone GrpE (heat shock protein)
VLRKIERMLRELNVEIIYPEGERFDPRCHEAVDFEVGQKDWVVSEVVEMGFALAGHVIKPAKVKVTVRGDRVGKVDRDRPWNH